MVYGRYPGLALVVGPKQTGKINSVKDLKDKKIGVSAPGSSTDFFLKYLLSKNGVDPNSVGVIGIGLGATAVAAMEQGSVDAAVLLDPAITQLQGRNKELKISVTPAPSTTRSRCSAANVRGGALYTKSGWIAAHPKETQALTNAILATLKWIHSHTPEEIMAKMPENLVGQDKALYLAALKNTIPDVFDHRPHGPQGRPGRARRVQPVVAPRIKNAKIDLSKTYTNKFVDAAGPAARWRSSAEPPIYSSEGPRKLRLFVFVRSTAHIDLYGTGSSAASGRADR